MLDISRHNRLERYEEAKALRQQKFTFEEIGQRIGLTASGAYRLLSRPKPRPRVAVTPLGKMILEILKAVDVPERVLAEEIGVHPRTLEAWIIGKNSARRYLIKVIETKYEQIFGSLPK